MTDLGGVGWRVGQALRHAAPDGPPSGPAQAGAHVRFRGCRTWDRDRVS